PGALLVATPRVAGPAAVSNCCDGAAEARADSALKNWFERRADASCSAVDDDGKVTTSAHSSGVSRKPAAARAKSGATSGREAASRDSTPADSTEATAFGAETDGVPGSPGDQLAADGVSLAVDEVRRIDISGADCDAISAGNPDGSTKSIDRSA